MTATCHTETQDRYCDLLGPEIARLAEALAGADPGRQVRTCPDWTIADLAEHCGGVHLWAGEHVRRRSPTRIRWAEMGFAVPPEPERAGWVAEGGPRIVEILRSADPEGEMWAWGADKHARFWARRMLHETTVHRADAELTLGREPGIDETVAVDGVDEFLDNLPHASWAPKVKELRGSGERVMLRSPAAEWLIRLEDDGFAWEHTGAGAADATVEASAVDLYLLVWGRRSIGEESIRADGDRSLLERWVQNSKL